MNRSFSWTVLLLWVVPATAQASDWAQWRGPDRNGISSEKGWSADWPKEGPKVLWSCKATGMGCSSMAVSANRVYTMGNLQLGTKDIEVTEKKKEKNAEGKEIVTEVKTMKTVAQAEDTAFCVDGENGAVLWKRGWEQALDPSGYEGGPCSTPCVDGNRVYFLGRTGRVSCLNTQNGEIVWEYMPPKPGGTLWCGIAASPMVYGNLLLASNQAFEKETGKIAWTVKRGCTWNSPTPFEHGGKKLIAFFSNAGLTAVNPVDGSEVWFFPWNADQNTAVPLFFEDKVFISSRRNAAKAEQCAVLQIGEKEPQVIWKNTNLPNYFFERVLIDGHVYGFDESKLKCIDLKTGDVKWEAPGSRGQLIASDGKLLIMVGGTLMVVEASPVAYKLLAKVDVVTRGTSIAPVLANGRLYCRGVRGDIACLDLAGVK